MIHEAQIQGDPEKKVKRKRKFLFLPLKQLFPYIGIITGILLFIFQKSLVAYSEKILGNFIMNFIQYETRGVYTIQYDKVRINIFTSELHLTDFEFKKDTLNQTSNKKQIDIHFKATALSLNVKSLLNFLINREIEIEGLELRKPHLVIIQNIKDDIQSSTISVDIIQKTKQYLNLFHINQLSVSNASIEYKKIFPDSVFSISFSDVSLNVKHFQFGESISPFGKSVYSQGVEVEILNQSLNILPGHKIYFDRAWASSFDSTLVVENLSIMPHLQNSNGDTYHLTFPEVRLSEFDLRGIIQQEKISAGLLDLGKGKATLRIGFNASVSQGPKPEPATLKGISAFIFENVITSNSDITVTFPLENKDEQTLILNDLTLHVKNMHIDSMVLVNPDKLLKNIDFDLNVGVFNTDFNGIKHSLSVNGININYQQGYLSFDGISLKPFSRFQKNQINISSNEVQVWGLNFPTAISEKSLKGRKAIINDPDILLKLNQTSSSGQTMNNHKNIYPLIQAVLTSLEMEEIQLRNARLTVRGADNEPFANGENLKITLHNILIDSTLANNPHQIFGIQDLSIEGSNLLLRVNNGKNEISSAFLSFNTRTGDIQVEEAGFISQSDNLVNFRIGSLSIRGLDMFKALYNDKIIIDSVKILAPSLKFSSDTVFIPTDSTIISSTPYFPDSIRIKYFTLADGYIEFDNFGKSKARFTDIKSEVTEFSVARAGPYLRWNSEAIHVENGPFSIILPDNTHTITGNSISISKSDSVLRINQFRIKPTNIPNKYFRLNIEIPNMLLTQIVPSQFLDSGYLDIGQILLLNPMIETTFSHASDTIETNTKSGFNAGNFSAKKISIINGGLHLEYHSEYTHTLDVSSFDFDINRMEIDTFTTFDASLSFFENLVVKAKVINYTGANGLDSVYAGSLDIDSDHHLIAGNLVLKGRNSKTNYDVVVNQFGLYGANWLRKLIRSDYATDSMIITEPKISITLTDSVRITAQQDNKRTESKDLSKDTQDFFSQLIRQKYVFDSVKGGDFLTAKPASENSSSFSLNINLPEFEDTVTISRVKLLRGTFRIERNGEKFDIPEFGIYVDSLNYMPDNSNLLHSADIIFEVSGLKDLLRNENNDLSIDRIRLSTKEQSVVMEGIRMEPAISKLEYGWKIGYQTDWIKLNVNSIAFNGLDFNTLANQGRLQITEIFIDSLDVKIFRDKHVPFPADQVRYMPQKMIAELSIPVSVEGVILNQANIFYEELDAESVIPGFIEIKNLTAGIHNITNDSARLAEDHIMQVAANGDLMGTGNMQVDFEFDLTDPDYKHRYLGVLSEMDLATLNKILEPNIRIHIKSGQVSKMNFNVEGDEYYTTGIMEMMYRDLHVNLIGKKKGTTSAMGPALGSFFANTFIINRNNPRFLFVRKGDIYWERDTTKSFFNYLAKTTLSGVVTSIGAKNNKKEIRQANKVAREKKDKEKKEKKKKKKRSPNVSTIRDDP